MAAAMPAFFHLAAQLASSAPHDCSSVLELIIWPYVAVTVRGVIGSRAGARLRG
ncbi:hypothetical protein [Nonomuraea sp. NPDC049480]|uniref:hypothetical protein n=1 Tax=Nonomuraea sp. NPDC049480 TaxID=3364353 RepID=UPI00378B545B